MTPEPPVSEAIWRRRFIIINLVRIGGTAIVLMGLAVWQTGWVREGGWPALGFPLALLGLLISFGVPRWLVSQWRTPPRQ